MVEAVEAGFPHVRSRNLLSISKAVERNEQVIVGVNKYVMDEEPSKVNILQIDEAVRDHQLERLAHVKATRDNGCRSIAR